MKISHDLQMGPQALAWVSTAYVLTFGGLQLLGGRLGDIFGRRRLFLMGLGLFTVSSLAVGFSVNGPMIIAMRAIQGIGSAVLAPTTLALLLDNYQGQMLQQGFNYYGMTAGLGASLGLLVGGLIASLVSWRVGFLINVPVGVILFGLTLRYVKPGQATQHEALDIPGALFSVLGIAGIIYSINGEAYRLVALILGVLFLVLFVLQERWAVGPIMPLQLFRDPTRVGAYITRFFIIGMSFSFLYLAPQLMQNLYHYTPLQASIATLLMSVPQFIFATQVGRLSKHLSAAKIVVLAAAISVVAMVWIALVGVQRGFWLSLAAPLVLVGIGQAFAMSPLTTLGVAHATPDIAGAASGVINTFHQTGQSIGLAVVVALTANIGAFAPAFNTAAVVLAGYAVVALVAMLNVVRLERRAH